MPYYTIYAFACGRTRSHAESFLHNISELANGVYAKDYERDYRMNPQDEWILFENSAKVFDYFETHPNESYAVYFRFSPTTAIVNVMIFYTEDANMIFGVDLDMPSLADMSWVDLDQDEKVVFWTNAMMESAGTDLILYSFDTIPPSTLNGFIKAMKVGQ